MKALRRIPHMVRFFADLGKDVEIFGMYNATNLGDEAMRIAGLRAVPDKRAVATPGTSYLSLLDRMKRARRRRQLMIGGGTLIHGGNPKGENHWLDYVETRLKQGSEISVFGTGLAFLESQIEVRSESFNRWARILRGATDVEVRGPLSQDIAWRMGVEARVFGDFVFSLFDPVVPETRKSLDRCNGRVLGFNIGECLGDQTQYERVCARVLGDLPEDFYVRFFVVTAKDMRSTENIIRAAKLSQGSYEILSIYLNPFEFVKQVMVCDAFIGLKLHASGLAMISGVPTLLFEYLPKCRDFVLPIDLEQCLLSLSAHEKTVESMIDDLLTRPSNYVNLDRISELAVDQRRRIALKYT